MVIGTVRIHALPDPGSNAKATLPILFVACTVRFVLGTVYAGMKSKKKKIIAMILKAMLDGGVKLESPYDVENWIEDNMSHEDMMGFFYENEEEADVKKKIAEALK